MDAGGKDKTTEQSQDICVPVIKVSEEGAAGGTEDNEGRKPGPIRSLVNKVMTNVQRLRSRSKSPETRRKERGSSKEGSDPVSYRSPSKKFPSVLRSIYKSKSRRDEEESLCEQEIAEDSRTRLDPPENDVSSSSISPTDHKPEPCPGYGFDACENSSVSSAPSGSSSLPEDDDSGVASTSDFTSTEDNKQK